MFSTIVFLMIVMALKLYNHGANSILFLFISLQESNEVCLSHQAICDQLSGTVIVSFKLPGPLDNLLMGNEICSSETHQKIGQFPPKEDKIIF